MAQETNFISDEPIKNISEDRFGREKFARSLAKAIREYQGQDSLVIGLSGVWGSGKTSVINMITEDLHTQENLVIIHFAPWYFSGQNKLYQQFFATFSKGLESYLDKIKNKISRLSKTVQRSANIVGRLGSALKPGVKYFAHVLPIPIETTEDILSRVVDAVQAFGGSPKQTTFDPVAEKKKIYDNLKKLHEQKGTKILVVIDDIDRLEKQEIRQVFQLVKGIANFPNTMYLLSFDVSVVTKALDDVQTPEGKPYLEKIVQVPFVIPKISQKQLHEFLDEEIKKIVQARSEVLFSPIYYHDLFHRREFKNYFITIREISRFLNVFQFEFGLLSQELNIVDLVVLSAIKSKDHELYEFIKKHKNIFCGTGISPYSILVENQTKQMKVVYSKMRQKFERLDIIEKFLPEVFPHFQKILSEHSLIHSNNLHTILKKERRVSHPDYFESFFRLSLVENQISRTEILTIIESSNDAERFCSLVQPYIQEQRAYQLFNELRANKQDFGDISIVLLAQKLSPLVDTLQKVEGSDRYKASFNDFDVIEIALFVIDLITLSYQDKDILSAVEELLRNIEGFALPEYLFYFYAIEYGFYTENRNGIDRNAENIKESGYGEIFEQIESQITKIIAKLFYDGVLQKKKDFARVWYLWKLMHPESAKIFFLEFTKDPENLVSFLSSSLIRSFGHPKIDTRIFYFMKEEDIQIKVRRIIDNEDCYKSLDEESKVAVETFMKQLKQI